MWHIFRIYLKNLYTNELKTFVNKNQNYFTNILVNLKSKKIYQQRIKTLKRLLKNGCNYKDIFGNTSLNTIIENIIEIIKSIDEKSIEKDMTIILRSIINQVILNSILLIKY